ncbi:sodium:alanine symporter family protein [Lentisphaerota bacterium ZTH]|nr:alanine:cation symporter family protein [Lentisphaerota bacterium]WET06314.1 sodium:alanine symporter family protein [Lentisphaerota bacterium ZTH]
MGQIIDFCNGILWNYILIYLLLGVGIYFTLKTRFLQLRHFGHMFSVMFNSLKAEHGGISAFGAFCTSLAARVGTGNMAGVAIAITVGGPGAMFWMWLIAMVGMVTSFAECTLAQVYKIKEKGGLFRGGPAYYMERGLKCRWMGVIFSIFLLIAYGFTFNAVQANSIVLAFKTAFNYDPNLIAIILCAFTAVIIFGGIRRIARFAEIVVPFMAMAYLVMALYVVGTHLSQLPAVMLLVFKSAFGLKAAAGGGVGVAIAKTVGQGVRRGLFSNEAGIGSSPNAAATADIKHPASQGYVQMLGVFTATIVICSATAAIIIISGVNPESGSYNGIDLTQMAVQGFVGHWGVWFVALALTFFAFTSIIANYYFGETSLVFIDSHHPVGITILRILLLGMVYYGSIEKSEFIWDMADLSMGLMAIVNLIALIMLSGVLFKVQKDYDKQRAAGIREPVFKASDFPELAKDIEPGIWT